MERAFSAELFADIAEMLFPHSGQNLDLSKISLLHFGHFGGGAGGVGREAK